MTTGIDICLGVEVTWTQMPSPVGMTRFCQEELDILLAEFARQFSIFCFQIARSIDILLVFLLGFPWLQ